MAVRTIESFVAYQANGGGVGIPLIARGAVGDLYLAAPDTTITGSTVSAFALKDAGPVEPSSNIHGVVEGFTVDVPDDRPGLWFVSGVVASYRPFVEGQRGEPGLPGANSVPTDEAVGALLGSRGTETYASASSVTRNVLGAELDDRTSALVEQPTQTGDAVSRVVGDRLSRPVDPLMYLANIEVICRFSMYKDDGDADARGYIQGISVNEAENELYASFGGGNSGWQRFEVRDLTTGVQKSERRVASEAAYTQGMPWFKKSNGDLCFVVFLKSAPAKGGSYQIYNYTKDTVGPDVPLASRAHGDRFGEYFVIAGTGGDAPNTTLNCFYLYSWDSIMAGAPELLKTIPVSNPGYTASKHQGETMNGQYFFVHAGQPAGGGGLPTITAYDFTGQLKGIYQHSVRDLMDAIEADAPGTLPVTNRKEDWEAEGITNAGGRLYTTHVFGNVEESTHAFGQYIRTVVILRHNTPTGAPVATKPVITYTRDTGWVKLTPVAGFTGTLRYRAKDGQVFVEGALTGDVPEGVTTLNAGTIPAVYRPKALLGRGAAYFKYNVTGGAYVGTSGNVGITQATGATRVDPQFSVTYLTD